MREHTCRNTQRILEKCWFTVQQHLQVHLPNYRMFTWYSLVAAEAAGGVPFCVLQRSLAVLILVGDATLVVRERFYV
jgi:hypothetical protein